MTHIHTHHRVHLICDDLSVNFDFFFCFTYCRSVCVPFTVLCSFDRKKNSFFSSSSSFKLILVIRIFQFEFSSFYHFNHQFVIYLFFQIVCQCVCVCVWVNNYILPIYIFICHNYHYIIII